MLKVVTNKDTTENHVRYKVVELSSVTDHDIEQVLNQYASQGWQFDGMQFAMRDSSKRPSMAFILFTKSAMSDEQDDGEVGE